MIPASAAALAKRFARSSAISQGDQYYVIDPNLCVECKGHFDEPQCASVCPTDSCVKQ